MKRPRIVISLAAAALALCELARIHPAMAAATAALNSGTAPGFTRTEDVVYGRKFGVALTLDVFQPVGRANGYAIIAIVSGGWKSSHEAIAPGSYAAFLSRGYTVFAVVHGSQPKFTISEIIPDIHRAVRFVRHNAARWGINPGHIGITGASAGGHLSLTLGTQGGPGLADAKDPVNRESSAVQAVACFFPPSDFLNYGSDGEVAVGAGRLADLAPAFGPDANTVEGRRTLGERISPVRFISRGMAPTLIIHGDADHRVPIQQSEQFVRRATAAGATAKLVVKHGAGHGDATWANVSADRSLLADWFDKYLRGRDAASP